MRYLAPLGLLGLLGLFGFAFKAGMFENKGEALKDPELAKRKAAETGKEIAQEGKQAVNKLAKTAKDHVLGERKKLEMEVRGQDYYVNERSKSLDEIVTQFQQDEYDIVHVVVRPNATFGSVQELEERFADKGVKYEKVTMEPNQ
jgi:hypothetical protein